MKKLITLALLTLILSTFVLPTFAQDVEVTEAPPMEEPVPDDMSNVEVEEGEVVISPVVEEQLETVFTNLVKLLWNAALLPFAAPMVLVLTALSKRLPVPVSSPIWSFVWTVVIWLGYLLATQLGFANQFETTISSLATIGSSFLGITITPALASKLHDYASNNNVAIIGYSKTPPKPAPVVAVS